MRSPLQPFDRQDDSVGGPCWPDRPSVWRRFPRQRERVEHSIAAIDGDAKPHGHNHAPAASGKSQTGGIDPNEPRAQASVTVRHFPAGQC